MSRNPQAKPGPRDAAANVDKPDRLDGIEAADNRTEHLDPERAGASTDPVEDLLDAGESDADYEDEAHRAASTLGPPDQAGGG